MEPIKLIVEDGSGVPDANTYADVTTVRRYAKMRGIVLNDDDEILKTNIIDAMDYVESFAARFKGQRVTRDQPLQFPRSGVYVEGDLLPYNVLPKTLINALCQFACDSATGGPLSGSTASFAIKKSKIEGLEIEYATGSTAQSAPAKKFDKAMAFLNPLLQYQLGNRLIR
ncbi:putative head-tail connector protein [Hafnia phage yong3]|nr:putative head-tail connector protein [Hafnia phage yong3]